VSSTVVIHAPTIAPNTRSNHRTNLNDAMRQIYWTGPSHSVPCLPTGPLKAVALAPRAPAPLVAVTGPTSVLLPSNYLSAGVH
jgi:hypothetical protein